MTDSRCHAPPRCERRSSTLPLASSAWMTASIPGRPSGPARWCAAALTPRSRGARLRPAPHHRPRARRPLRRARARRVRPEVALHRDRRARRGRQRGACPGSARSGRSRSTTPSAGLNATAVEVAARQGARIVWLPTVSAPQEYRRGEHGRPRRQRAGVGALRARAARGGRHARAVPVLDAARPAAAGAASRCSRSSPDHDLVLATGPPLLAGRSSPSSTPPCRPASATIVVTHPEFPSQRFRPRSSGQLADRGALMERAFTTPVHRQVQLGPGLRSHARCRRRSAPSGAVTSARSSTPPWRTGSPSWPTTSWRPASATGGAARWRCRTRGAWRGSSMRRVQVIGAHSADFVWRAGGAVAKAVSLRRRRRGDRAVLRRAGRVRRAVEAGRTRPSRTSNASATPRPSAPPQHLGASFRCLDLGDYPLQIDADALLAIADVIRAFAPDVLITHTDTDPFNPDHPVAHAAVDRARSLAAGAGVSSAFPTITPPQLFLFEPHQPELCNFTPDGARRHHLGVGHEARRDGGDAGPAVPADLLRPARRAARQPRAPGLGRPVGALRASPFSASSPQVVAAAVTRRGALRRAGPPGLGHRLRGRRVARV